MIWDMKAIVAIGRLRTVAGVSTEHLARGGDELVKAVADKLYRELQEMAYTHAAELALEDIVFSWDEPETGSFSGMRRLRARWEPATTGVRMLGGPLNGTLVQVPKSQLRRFPIRVAQAPDTGRLWGTCGDDEIPEAITAAKVLEYQWTGWDDAEGVWIYSLEEGQ